MIEKELLKFSCFHFQVGRGEGELVLGDLEKFSIYEVEPLLKLVVAVLLDLVVIFSNKFNLLRCPCGPRTRQGAEA